MSMLFKRIKDWGATATGADLVAGNYLALDGEGGSKKLPADEYPVPLLDLSNDLSFVDENGNKVFVVRNGELLTRFFDSSLIKVEGSGKSLELKDLNGKTIASFVGGKLVTGNFDSSKSGRYAQSKNYGKSVATFGGSHSVYPEGDAMRNFWHDMLGMDVTCYGVGGNGYSSLQTPDHNVQRQIDEAGVHDIYVLMCSTNDFTYNREIGQYNNYSFGDGYDTSKLVNMCGGINYAIKKAYELNPSAKVVGFTGLPFFTRYSGYNEFSEDVNSLGYNYYNYCEEFKKTMNWNHLPVLDLFHDCGFNVHNKSIFYKTDDLHLTWEGYERIAMMTADFLASI